MAAVVVLVDFIVVPLVVMILTMAMACIIACRVDWVYLTLFKQVQQISCLQDSCKPNLAILFVLFVHLIYQPI